MFPDEKDQETHTVSGLTDFRSTETEIWGDLFKNQELKGRCAEGNEGEERHLVMENL